MIKGDDEGTSWSDYLIIFLIALVILGLVFFTTKWVWSEIGWFGGVLALISWMLLLRFLWGKIPDSELSLELQNLLQQLADPLLDTYDITQRVELIQRALELLPKEGNEYLWASLCIELGNVIAQNPIGNREDNFEQAIATYQQALEVYTQTAFPAEWALTQYNLGIAFSDRIKGSREDNLEQAIQHYQLALEVSTRTTFPAEWAITQYNLGNVYTNRIQGSREDNLEQAIYHYQLALEVRTQTEFPGEWSLTQNNLGNVYTNRIQGSHEDNLEQAIYHYQLALEIYVRPEISADWAMTQCNLANAYIERIKESRVDNLEQAIYHYQLALEIYTQTEFPVDWAITHNSLGIVYENRILGSREDNLEKAIQHYQLALEIYTQTEFPVDWAITQNNLANVYTNRIRGSRTENIEQAIYYGKQALEVSTRETNPEGWAGVQNNLGNAYRNQIQGSRVDNLEQAIQHYQLALEVYTNTASPQEWAMVQNNLGNAYRGRIKGSRANNLEQAIHYYQQALEVRTRQANPEGWATTQNNLGTAFADRIKGSREDNLEQAIHCYQQALEVRTRQANPEGWATTQDNLGNAYRGRIKGSREDNLEQAVHYYQQALEVRTCEANPKAWATTQDNLGNAYRGRIKGSREDNLEQAIHYYQQALEVRTREANPKAWATTQDNLGNVYHSRIKGSREDNLEQAIHYYQQALEIYTRSTFPLEHRRILCNMVSIYFNGQRWAEALQTSLSATAVGMDIFSVGISDAVRLDALRLNANLHTRAAYSAIKLERYDEALKHLEAGKARLLLEALSLGDANLTQLTDEERRQVKALREEIKKLEYELRLSDDDLVRRAEQVIIRELGIARRALRELIEVFRAQYPDFMPEGLELDELLGNIPTEGALVAPLFTNQGSIVFIVPYGVHNVTSEHVLPLDDFKLENLNIITRGTAAENPGWLAQIAFYRFGLSSIEELFNGIEDTMYRLWDVLVGRIHERLQSLGVQRVLLMPQGDTNLLPLHAAWWEQNGVRRYFIDDYTITYTPSISTLVTAKRKSQVGEGAFVAGVSEYQKMNNLPNTKAEAQSIAALFGISALLDGEVSISAVREGARGKTYVHLSSHGGFGWSEDAFASALYLGNDEALQLPQIMANLPLDTARLVVLSACETGIVDYRNVLDEFVGLPAGFMQAGASAVISSLWTVEDRSTALLMERMYKNILEQNQTPAQALREAQFWLRDATAQEIGTYYQSYLVPRMSQSEAGKAFIEVMMRAKPDDKPYAHPFYWAAFTYNGL